MYWGPSIFFVAGDVAWGMRHEEKFFALVFSMKIEQGRGDLLCVDTNSVILVSSGNCGGGEILFFQGGKYRILKKQLPLRPLRKEV
jgi:hypothetical protein